MTREYIIKELSRFFKVSELVCNHTYEKWGESSWQFLDTYYLHCLLVIRKDILNTPMICNTETSKERGLRCNMCSIVRSKNSVYLSAHIQGKAGDFSMPGMTAEEARKKIIERQGYLPCSIRMEDKVSWLHFDVRQDVGQTRKVKLF